MRKRRLTGLLLTILLTESAAAQSYEVVNSFLGSGGDTAGRLLATADGRLFGTVREGGAFGRGSIFVMTPDGSGGFTSDELHAFTGPDGAFPRDGVVLASDGRLYGTTASGGRADGGTIFRLDSRRRLTVIFDSADSDGSSPRNLFQGLDGRLYGTSAGGAQGAGKIFAVTTDGAFATLHDFAPNDGSGPTGLVQGPDGRLFGTAIGGGTNGLGIVFALDLAGSLQTLHSFDGSAGSEPDGLTLVPDGNLYGTTFQGGSSSKGTLYRITQAGAFTPLYSFQGTGDGVKPSAPLWPASDGNLYGVTTYFFDPITFAQYFPTLFRLETSGVVTPIHEFPQYGATGQGFPLTQGIDSHLYGPARGSVPGTVFRIDLAGTAEEGYQVEADRGPWAPRSNLVESTAGTLYGLGSSGIPSRKAVFRIDASGEAFLVYSFPDPKVLVRDSLLLGSDGNLYGATGGNGVSDFGSVFRVDPGGGFTSVHQFSGTDGSNPNGELWDAGGEIWGTTRGGGASGLGTAFRIDASGGFFTEHEFAGPEGAGPLAGLILASDGSFYGTTEAGGAQDFGAIFRMDALGNVTPLHSFVGFDDPDGSQPEGALLEASDGNFYGSTRSGGADGFGTIFRIDSVGTLTKVYDFPVSSGQGAGAVVPPLIQASDGGLYGTFPGNFQNDGSVFRLDFASGGLTTIHDFTGPDGSQPRGALLNASDGAIHGVASSGGLNWPFGSGTAYRILASASDPTSVMLDPRSGRAAGGAAVVIRGHHFQDGASAAFGGAQAAPVFFAREGLLTAVTPALQPGTLNDITVANPIAALREGSGAAQVTLPDEWFADFLDVPGDHAFHDVVETVFRNGITAGCGGGNYCPQNPVRRDQMAVFLLKAEQGAAYIPPACSGVFADVACPGPFTDWVEQLAAEGITGGCGAGNYCPGNAVTRQQMAVFLLKAKHGSTFVPPACNGDFLDVDCPGNLFADWIEQLAAELITGGCGGGNYCPLQAVRRDQMAAFLDNTFDFP